MRILLVEDDRSAAELLRGALEAVGWEVALSFEGDRALALIERERFDVVVSDVDLPGMTGIDLARAALSRLEAPPRFILVSGQDRIIESVNSLELGVDDFLPKPLNLKRLVAILRRIDERRAMPAIVPAEEIRRWIGGSARSATEELPEPLSLLAPGEAPFIGVYGPKMLEVCERIRKVAPYSDIPVLIEGETGTGKELAARYVSIVAQEDEGPFVGLNCSLFNSEFFAAELFGYEHGAFTGAAQRGKTGKLDLAEGGCLFLDEITEMSSDLQSRLLRVLQERNFYRLGGDRLVEVKCRFVFATNRDIRRLVAEGLFRPDLFYRLSMCIVSVPPLRERREEIIPLAIRFLRAMRSGSRLSARYIENSAFDLLEGHEWPGNARQLQNVISSWALFESGETLRASSLAALLAADHHAARPPEQALDGVTRRERNPTIVAEAAPPSGTAALSTADPPPPSVSTAALAGRSPVGDGFGDLVIPDRPFDLAVLEREIVRRTLEKFGGNKTKTAEYLGISRSQLYDKYR